MTLISTTLRPGLLVSLKTGVRGGIKYTKQVIEEEHATEQGESTARWETERRITAPAEYKAATKARMKARSIISSVCANSAFGLLCPEEKMADLENAIEAARAVVDDYNARSSLTRVVFYVICGKVASDDLEAVRAINSEVRDLMDDMNNGIRNLDPDAIRKAADQARDLGKMLSERAQQSIQVAIDAARKAASKIAKVGVTAGQEIDAERMRRIGEARLAFLDIEPGDEVAPVAPVAMRAVDLGGPDSEEGQDSAEYDSERRMSE